MHLPYSVQVELSLGCTRQCDFCGLQAVWKQGKTPVKFMSLETAEIIAKKLGEWLPKARIEFAMFGEPTLNSHVVDILKVFTEYFPKGHKMLNTNGDILIQHGKNIQYERIKSLFDAGLNVLAINVYEDEYYKTILQQLKENINYAKVGEYFEGQNYYNYGNPKTRKEITLVKSIASYNGDISTRVIYNHAGNVPDNSILKYGGKVLAEPIKAMCTKPFREMVFRYNGDISFCCFDVANEARMGNVLTDNLNDMWFGNEWNERRKHLLDKQRTDIPCNKCNYPGGFRKGLEYNWFKK